MSQSRSSRSATAEGRGGPARALPIGDDDLVACVACGLCLPHCPTYRVTGREIASPRGRIAAMRAVQFSGAPIDAAFETAMDECVQCRGCEAACPSGVPFGRLMEGAREALAPRRNRFRRGVEWLAYRVILPHHLLLLALTWVLVVAQRLRLVPRRLGLPDIAARSLLQPLRAPEPHDPGAEAAWLFPGCVMDAWQRDTHRSALRVMAACGATGLVPDRSPCCGALALHAGYHELAQRLATQTIAAFPGGAPVVVDSAGCAAAMKSYGDLVGTPEARAFAGRVQDFSEWAAEHGPLPIHPSGRTIVVQDPCHLRHVQRQMLPLRRVLGTAYTLVEAGDEGLCCGAGGAYSVLQPALANSVRDRKIGAIRAVAGDDPVVASANPGCIMHLRAGGLDVRHVADLLAEVLDV